MRSEFYHEFMVGFNLWYVVLPLMLIVAVLVGMGKYWLDKDCKIWHFKEVFMKVPAIIAGILAFGMMCAESFTGAYQVCVNLMVHRNGEGVIIAGMVALFGIAVLAALYGYLFYVIADKVAEKRLVVLKRKRRNRRKVNFN